MEITVKICPKCNQESSADNSYCPFDGEKLHYKPIDNFCVTCEKQYATGYQFCPVHGEELITFTPPSEETPKNSEEDADFLDEKAQDSFSRGTCPKCGAWKNWATIGEEYTCRTCMQAFVYKDGKIFGSKEKSTYQIEIEKRETLPQAPILSAIDASNKEYWLIEFEKFEADPKYSHWNWPSFFFDVNRYLWKGMWKKGLIILAIVYGGGFLIGFFNGLFKSHSGSSLSPLFFFIFLIGVASVKVYLGTDGAKDYYKHIKNFEGDLAKAKTSRNIGRILLAISIIIYFLSKVFR